MPEGIAATMSPRERRDLVRFLMELGKPGDILVGAGAPAPSRGSDVPVRSCTAAIPIGGPTGSSR